MGQTPLWKDVHGVHGGLCNVDCPFVSLVAHCSSGSSCGEYDKGTCSRAVWDNHFNLLATAFVFQIRHLNYPASLPMLSLSTGVLQSCGVGVGEMLTFLEHDLSWEDTGSPWEENSQPRVLKAWHEMLGLSLEWRFVFFQSPTQCLAYTRPTKQWVFIAVNNIDVNRYMMVSVVSHMWKILS